MILLDLSSADFRRFLTILVDRRLLGSQCCNLTGDQYIRDLLQPVVVPHFDNARSHRSRAVTAYLQSEAVTSVPRPVMSPDLNPIEHICDMLGRRILARVP
jgi:hypothetical protein